METFSATPGMMEKLKRSGSKKSIRKSHDASSNASIRRLKPFMASKLNASSSPAASFFAAAREEGKCRFRPTMRSRMKPQQPRAGSDSNSKATDQRRAAMVNLRHGSRNFSGVRVILQSRVTRFRSIFLSADFSFLAVCMNESEKKGRIPGFPKLPAFCHALEVHGRGVAGLPTSSDIGHFRNMAFSTVYICAVLL